MSAAVLQASFTVVDVSLLHKQHVVFRPGRSPGGFFPTGGTDGHCNKTNEFHISILILNVLCSVLIDLKT